jgi:hypothetical protein
VKVCAHEVTVKDLKRGKGGAMEKEGTRENLKEIKRGLAW